MLTDLWTLRHLFWQNESDRGGPKDGFFGTPTAAFDSAAAAPSIG